MLSITFKRGAALVAAAAVFASLASPAAAFAAVKMGGSTTLQPLAQSWANAYKTTRVTVVGGGSGTGFSGAYSGAFDIGMSSREVAAGDTKSGNVPKMTPVARDALTIIVNPKNNVKVLTQEQVYRIFTGKVTKWSQVGGKTHKVGRFKWSSSHAIVLAGRTGASGTYGYFIEKFLNPYGATRQSKRTKAYASNGMVRAAVVRDPYAIGYVGMAFARGGVRALRIAPAAGQPSVSPTKANAMSGAYPYVRYLYFVTYPTARSLSSDAQNFINWVLSPAGQVIANREYLPL